MKKNFVVLFVGLQVYLTSGVLSAGTVNIDFEAIDTSSGLVFGAAVDTYLGGFGVTLTNLVDPTTQVFVRQDGVIAEAPSSGVNFFSQQGGASSSRSYDLEFSQPLDSFGFTRVAYFGSSPSGLIYPQWSATIFDQFGGILGIVGEAVNSTFATVTNPVPAQSFSLTGPGIAKVRFFGDHLGFAGRAAAGIDDLVLETTAVPEPSGIVFLFATVACMAGYGWRRKKKSVV